MELNKHRELVISETSRIANSDLYPKVSLPKIISVFKTSLAERDLIALAIILDNLDELIRWNTDLDDCDKILRIESYQPITEEVKRILAGHGYIVEELEDFIPT